MAEAKLIQQEFDQKTRNTHIQSTGPQSNLFFIAAQKIKAICTTYAPMCNFCGNVCDNQQWYRKLTPANSFSREDEDALTQLKEKNSIHQTLKEITSTYIVCKECFDLGNYPKILSPTDFEKTSMNLLLNTQEFEIP